MRKVSWKIIAVLLIIEDCFRSLTSDLHWEAFPNVFPTPFNISCTLCSCGIAILFYLCLLLAPKGRSCVLFYFISLTQGTVPVNGCSVKWLNKGKIWSAMVSLERKRRVPGEELYQKRDEQNLTQLIMGEGRSPGWPCLKLLLANTYWRIIMYQASF